MKHKRSCIHHGGLKLLICLLRGHAWVVGSINFYHDSSFDRYDTCSRCGRVEVEPEPER